MNLDKKQLNEGRNCKFTNDSHKARIWKLFTMVTENTLQVQTGLCGCTPDSGGTTGFWWCIYRILLVHLER